MDPTAFVREVTDSFSRCVTAAPVDPPLDPAVARAQHAAYREALEAGGFRVVAIPGDEDHPDGCFVEDAAVVIGDTAVVARPGHPSRSGETEAVAAALAGVIDVVELDGGSLDGGDVLQVGERVFVGIGGRTDAEGAEALDRICRPMGRSVTPVPIGGLLHLKSGVTALDDRTVLWHRDACDPAVFDRILVVPIPGKDPEAANVARLPDGGVLVGAAHDVTAEVVDALGHRVVRCDTSEFARADGGLTCLSVRIPGAPATPVS